MSQQLVRDTIATKLTAGGFRFQIPTGTTNFSLLQNDQTDSGSHPTCNSNGPGFFLRHEVARA